MVLFSRSKLKSWFPKLTAAYQLVLNKESYLYKTGWMNSLDNRPKNEQGNPLPWMNFSVIKLLNDRLNENLTVFEFGSGFSTLYFSKLVKHVDSIEYDAAWFDTIKHTQPANASIQLIDSDVDGEYCRAASKGKNKYDLIIVDGRDRVNCVVQSIDSLSPHGVLILDDSDRQKYQAAFTQMRENGFKVLTLEGLKPTGWRIDATSIFYRDGNCLGI